MECALKPPMLAHCCPLLMAMFFILRGRCRNNPTLCTTRSDSVGTEREATTTTLLYRLCHLLPTIVLVSFPSQPLLLLILVVQPCLLIVTSARSTASLLKPRILQRTSTSRQSCRALRCSSRIGCRARLAHRYCSRSMHCKRAEPSSCEEPSTSSSRSKQVIRRTYCRK
jgi:hypothetical protein